MLARVLDSPTHAPARRGYVTGDGEKKALKVLPKKKKKNIDRTIPTRLFLAYLQSQAFFSKILSSLLFKS